MKSKTRKKRKPFITLALTHKQASALACIFYRVGGNPSRRCPRGQLDMVYDKLCSSRRRPLNTKLFECVGTITINNAS